MSRQVGAAKKRKQYDPDVLKHVAELVRNDVISMTRASKEYGIPKTTLHDAVHTKYQSNKVGPKTVLSTNEENRLAEWAVRMSKIGYGRTRKELLSTVKKILDEDGRENPFRNNRPGKDWLKAFFGRHPQLTVRTTLQLGKERAILSAEKIERWFSDLKLYVETELGDPTILTDPSRMYNADESGFSLCVKGSKVIGCKGAPVVYSYGNSDKTQLTVMAASSATGHYVPPMIIFPGQRFSYNPLEGFEEAALGRSDSGWMDSEVFCNWLTNVFIPAIDEKKVKKPVLLLIDGHSTHVTIEASDTCVASGIELYCLLEHSSHVMQPLDLRLFSSLKQTWKQSVRDWQSEHVGELVTKRTFARVFKQAWTRSTTVDAAVNGFLEAGLYPLNPAAVTKSVKLEPSKLFAETPRPSTSATLAGVSVLSNTPSVSDIPPLPSQDEVTPPVDTADQTREPAVVPVLSPSQGDVTNGHVLEPVAVSPRSLRPGTSQAGDSEQVHGPPELPITPTVQTINPNPPASPFSKFLAIPVATTSTSNTKSRAKKTALPKAITGSAYRKLLVEKKAQKDQELHDKLRRKEERLQKRKEREQDKDRKKREQVFKRQRKADEREKKRILREKMLNDSDSDDAQHVSVGKCYACEQGYDDYIECSHCFKRFHFQCATDELMETVEDMPFECKYC